MPLERAIRTTVLADAAVILTPRAAPWTLSVAPGDGGTVTLEVSATPAAQLGPDGTSAAWHALGEPLTEAALLVFPGPVVAVRVTASSAAAGVELVS